MGGLFLYLDSTNKCAIIVNKYSVSVLHQNGTKQFCHAMFLPTISVLGEAPETIWRQVNMAIVKSLLHFTTIVHGSFMFSFKNSPFTLEFEMLRQQKVSHLLATSFKILVANAQFLVALVSSELQFWTVNRGLYY